jgi:nicotinamidase/pyrazinamidase
MDRAYKALLIVDMLKDFIEDGAPLQVPAAKGIVENIAGEIRYAREKGRPVIYLCDRHTPDDPEFENGTSHAVAGTPGADVIDALAPQPGDHLVEKTSYSGFFRSNLETLLDELEIEEVLICGVHTNTCVLYTAVDALQRGLKVIVPETCVAGTDEEDHKFALRQIHEVLRPVGRD